MSSFQVSLSLFHKQEVHTLGGQITGAPGPCQVSLASLLGASCPLDSSGAAAGMREVWEVVVSVLHWGDEGLPCASPLGRG